MDIPGGLLQGIGAFPYAILFLGLFAGVADALIDWWKGR